MNKINYYQKSLEELERIKKLDYKPSILIHSCCGPCSTFPLTFLHKYFDITIYYNNSNIYPSSEYDKRLNELKGFIKNKYPDIKLVVPPYKNDEYNKFLDNFGDMPEGRERCFACYTKRMNEGFIYASENNFNYYTTVMSISRQKNSQKLNEIGSILENKYKTVKYFYSDFKKKDGNLVGNKIARENDMYRQEYCGCIYSFKNHKNK